MPARGASRGVCMPGLVMAFAVAVTAAGRATAEDPLRARAREAFTQGDYAAMTAAYARLSEQAAARLAKAGDNVSRLYSAHDDVRDDWVGLGHAHQLAGEWSKAVGAYREGVRALDLTIRALIAEKDNPQYRPSALHACIYDRAVLLSLIGRIQRDALKDLPGAAATFAAATDYCPAISRPLGALLRDHAGQMARLLKEDQHKPAAKPARTYHFPLMTLKELALTQERMGRIRAAIETRCRADLATRLYGGVKFRADVVALGALVAKLPAGGRAPDVPFLVALAPGARGASLRMDEPQVLARAYRTHLSQASNWHFALSPPPGKEFASLRLACDIEQIQERYGGHVKITAWGGGLRPGWISAGSISWHNEGPPGRKEIVRRVEVPLGAKLVSIVICQWKDKFRVHRVDVEAEFRVGEILPPEPKVVIQTHVLPAGGVLTCNGEPLRAGVAYHDVEPGRYTFTYTVPGRERVFRGEATLVPGGRYMVFANLDSPFQRQLTNLRHVPGWSGERLSLVRLPTGRWLAAYTGAGRDIRLSTSRDAVHWEEPWTLPHSGLFRRSRPALCVGDDGTVWLAYFCDRLRCRPYEGSNLWVRSSRDARTWSEPRPLCMDEAGRSRRAPWLEFQTHPATSPTRLHMLRDSHGRHWVFFGELAGCGDTPGLIGGLRKIQMHEARRASMAHSIVVDERGRFHMLFTDHRRGICHSTSTDGWRWSGPEVLDGSPKARRTGHAHLILDGERAALICGGQWRRGRLEPKPQFGPPVALVGYGLSHPCVTPDGQVLLLAGSDTVWLMRAPLAALTRPGDAEF